MEMQSANCFVLPTRYEAFGAVLIEAMATGLPVIATRSGGPDHIVSEDNGLLIEPENVAELAGAMKQMILRNQDYSGDRIRANTLERYGQSKVMNQYHQIFRQLLEE